MHKEIDNMNRLMTLKEIESIINIFSKMQQAQMGLLVNFSKYLKKRYQFSLNRSRKYKKRRTIPNSSYNVSVTLIPKPKTLQ